MGRDGAGACTILSQASQLIFGRTWRTTLKQARTCSSISATSSPSTRSLPGSSICIDAERAAATASTCSALEVARSSAIRQKRDDGGVKKTFAAYVRRADEGTLSRLVVEASILLAASRGNPTAILKEAAATYKVDTDAINAKVKQEFAAKAKAKSEPKPAPKERKAA
jgi:ParB family chromosome partitioning protein